MLSKDKIKDAVLKFIFKPNTPDNAKELAAELGVPLENVRFGAKAIEITADNQTVYVQIKQTGNDIEIFESPPE